MSEFVSRKKLQIAFDRLELGKIVSEPENVGKSSRYSIWQANTDKERFIVKLLNIKQLQRPKRHVDFENSEIIAHEFASCGLPAVTAYKFNNSHVQSFGKANVLVYPFFDDQAMRHKDVKADRCRLIGKMLGVIHSKRIQVEGIEPITHPTFPPAHWKKYFAHASVKKSKWAELVKRMPDFPNIITRNYKSVISDLQNNLVVSHCEITQKSTIWLNPTEFKLINWEFAGYINPVSELFQTAIKWSGYLATLIDYKLFRAVISGYKETVGIMPHNSNALIADVLAKHLELLEYNIRRSLDRRLEFWDSYDGSEQAVFLLQFILRLINHQGAVIANWHKAIN